MLILPTKKRWLDMVLSGEKKEDYREIKPYYTKRFQTIGLLDMYGLPTFVSKKILLRNGYSSICRQALIDVSLDIKEGREEWGAEPNKEYYCLRINKICISD